MQNRKQKEEELLAAFRAIDEDTQSVILRFAQGQASKGTKSPKLSVIFGGRHSSSASSTPQSIPRKI